jgi:dihydrodipicolinate synthase/N-acetylneuraminate lyase
VANRIPILVGVTDTAFAESLAVANVAATAGASAVVLAPPPYFRASQGELLEYVRRFATASPLPVVLYNMPALTKTSIEAETVRAAAEHPNIVGLKDSSGDLVYFHRVQHVLRDRPDFTLLVGPEELLAESVLVGGHGGVNGGANLVPELYVSLYLAAREGRLEEVRRRHAQVIALANALYGIAGGGASMIRSLKAALSLRGLCDDAMAEPFARPSASDRDQVAACLAALKL